MLRSITLGTLLTFSFLTISAQNGVHLDAFGIGQQTWMTNKADADSSNIAFRNTFGYSAAAGISYVFDDYLGIGLDAIYSKQGQNTEAIFSDTILLLGVFEETSLTMLKLPVTMRFYSDRDARFHYRAAIGPQLNILLSAKRIYPATPFYDELSGDVKEQFKTVSLALTTSHGVAFRASKWVKIFLDLRADYALGDAEKKDEVFRDIFTGTISRFPDNRPKTHNATLGLSLGFSYLL